MNNQYDPYQQYQQYQPPSRDLSSDALYNTGRMQNHQGGRPNPHDHWAQVNKQKSKHYNDLTSFLCIVFSVVCIARAVAIGIQTSDIMSCPRLPTYQIVHIVNYGLWALLFISCSIAMKLSSPRCLNILFWLCCLNIIYKIAITVIIGVSSDLQGSCFLVVNFKLWIWVFGLVECFFFILLMAKVKQAVENLKGLKM